MPQPVPEFMEEGSVFEQIRTGDILLHHPYQTFEPVIRFVSEAAKDPDVRCV